MRRTYCALAGLFFLVAFGCGGGAPEIAKSSSNHQSDLAMREPMSRVGSSESGAVFAGGGGGADAYSHPSVLSSETTHDSITANTESYDRVVENKFLSTAHNPFSTFSVDVDTASYSLVRRFLLNGQLPPQGAVRIEEMVNYFSYADPLPSHDAPFSVRVEVADCPWNRDHRLARIGLKGKQFAERERPPTNLVFLIDVSGSMNVANKLPLVKSSLNLLVDRLSPQDRVAIVVYAGASGLVLPSTPGDEKADIRNAINRLHAGGSTNGAAGIQLAYQTATEHFIQEGANRVILCTDGDFNIGVTNQSDLVRLVEKQARTGVFLTVLGFGMGNFKDSTLEKLADKGNGSYGYIDNQSEAQKIFCEQLQGTLVTIAKDVKLQVEFNPVRVAAYKLIGYENRLLATEDFRNDAKDAGDIGAGHSVTALYEIVPTDGAFDVSQVITSNEDRLKYQGPADLTPGTRTAESFTVAVRYKEPQGATSRLLEFPVIDRGEKLSEASADLRWSAAVAAFGMLLRGAKEAEKINYPVVADLAESACTDDPHGHRSEFLQMIAAARKLR